MGRESATSTAIDGRAAARCGTRVLLVSLAIVVAGIAPVIAEPAPGDLFADAVGPLLTARCLECHGEDEASGGLRLDLRAGWERGGDSGPAIVPGDPDRSLLVRAVRWETGVPQMPPDGRLSAAEIGVLAAWVRGGAHDPRGGPIEPGADAARGVPRGMTAAEGRRFWSLVPLARPTPPEVAEAAWNLRPIDRFIRARLDAAGIAPSPEAPAEILARRITFDLTGLPATPEAIDAFVAAHRLDPDAAVADLVERLLGDVAFGERFGRRWLDLARFAESSGGGRTLLFKDAWRYRDWVIDAFNRDVPFDHFVSCQLAGDLLASARGPTDHDAAGAEIVASGFLALGPTNYEEQDKAQLRLDIVDEQLETIGRAFLGLSIGCARCHDHPFDPITQADYHALAGIFTSTRTLHNETDNVARWIAAPLPESPAIAARRADLDARSAALRKERGDLGKPDVTLDPAGVARLAEIESELARLTVELPPRPTAMAVAERADPADTWIRIRGIEKNRGPVVPRGPPAVFGGAIAIPAGASGRRELATWVGDPENALARRVIVNRLWGWLFGRGIVATVDDFGASGEGPTHPELLDWLACRFAEEGGRFKPLVREIVLSRTYRQASLLPSDPAAALWGGTLRRRLEAEQIRDGLLAASGRLDRAVGGPTIAGAGDVDANDTAAQTIEYGYVFDDLRRGVYTPAFRNRRPEVFEVFDFSDINASSGLRTASTAAPQALFLANHPFVLDACRGVAERAQAEATDRAGRVERAFRLLLGRRPSPAERQAAETFLDRAGADPDALMAICRAIVESPDFRFLD